MKIRIEMEFNLSLENISLGVFFTALFAAMGFIEGGPAEGILAVLFVPVLFFYFMNSKFEAKRSR